MATTSSMIELYNVMEKTLNSKEAAELFVRTYERDRAETRQELKEAKQEVKRLFDSTRQQSKHELRDELSKELASKADLEMVQVALKSDIEQLRTEVKSDIEQLRTEVKSDIELVKANLEHLRTELTARIEKSELKTNFQTVIIILAVLLTSPGGTSLIHKLLSFIK